VRITEHAIQVCGGYGYVRDLPVEKWYRDAKLYTIFEGTSEIQRVVIGRTLADQAPKGPLHFRLPGDGDGLRASLGRGSETRSRVGMALLRLAERMPEQLMEIGGKVVQPPKK
jgi:acyl-CoA dehydrogenase